MVTSELASWFAQLEEEDRQFIKRLVLASGSLKELAEIYDVSYPTLRLRLDRLIERIKILDAPSSSDPFHAKIRLLVADGEISPKTGKELLQIHRNIANGGRK